MKIKEVEKLTGITAKNIRYYEEAGLLTPKRNLINQYREYSDEDITTLKRIKIFRKLDLPIQEIKRLENGEVSLNQAMEQQDMQLSEMIKQMTMAKKLCKEIGNETLENLNSDYYLEKIETLEQEGNLFMNIMDDFKRYLGAQKYRKFTFAPDERIATAEQMTLALFAFADDEQLDLVITKEGLRPELQINGHEYIAYLNSQAIYHGPGIQTVCIEAKNPDDLVDGHVESHKLRLFEWGYHGLLWALSVALLTGFITRNAPATGIVLLLEIGYSLYKYRPFQKLQNDAN